MDVVAALVTAIWIMLPAYVPNNVAVLSGGGRPIDGGKTWRGRRVLGDGKTWRGTVVGISAGIALAFLLNAVNGPLSNGIGVSLPIFSIAIALAFPIGALVGDMAASFLKRRTGRERGAAFPGVDQFDFLVMALLFGVIADPGWVLDVFTPLIVGIVLVVTPILHVSTNVAAYHLDLKSEPW